MITRPTQRNVFYEAETMLWPRRSFLCAILCAVTIIVLSGKATASPSTPILGRQDCVGEVVAGDTLTLDEVREMIVGTWIEDVDGDIGSYKKGDLKWVFTEDGKIRKYRNGSRYATQDYAVVEKYDGQQAPDDIAGYLKFTDQDGEVSHMTLSSIRRDDRFPHLSVGTHGIAGSTETLFFVPARVFE